MAMNIDSYGLITTSNKRFPHDGGDTLSNEGFYRAGLKFLNQHTTHLDILDYPEFRALLRRDDGLWIRHPDNKPGDTWSWNDPKESGRDQLDPLIIYLGEEAHCGGPYSQVAKADLDELWKDMWKRGWFYQNKDWGGAYISIWIRAKRIKWLKWLLPLTDWALYIDAWSICKAKIWDHDLPGLWKFRARKTDDVDDKVSVARLMQAWHVWPTSRSQKAVRFYIDNRPKNDWGSRFWNYRLGRNLECLGALFGYFREESGNNPEIGELWIYLEWNWFTKFYPIIDNKYSKPL